VTHLATFLGISALVIATPGQDTVLTIRTTLVAGRPGGIRTALGVAVGQFCWTVAAAAGLAAVVAASEPVFRGLRLAGAAYLVYLGLHTLLRRGALPAGGQPVGPAFRQGLLSNLGNPKMAVFFTSLLPQFGSSFAELLGLGLVFCLLTLTWLSGYAVAVAKAGDFLRSGRTRRVLDTVAGLSLVGLGMRLGAERG
jgi:threonine/homoserine/homoserine lactone efflux protein